MGVIGFKQNCCVNMEKRVNYKVQQIGDLCV